MDYKTYLEEINFDKYLHILEHRLKNKTSVIYGSGSFFQYVNEHYDLSKLNIVAISDIKYKNNDKNKDFLGYQTISKEKIKEIQPDYVFVAILQYNEIIEEFKTKLLHKTKIKVLPLFRKRLKDAILEWLRD